MASEIGYVDCGLSPISNVALHIIHKVCNKTTTAFHYSVAYMYVRVFVFVCICMNKSERRSQHEFKLVHFGFATSMKNYDILILSPLSR